jgi:hypothetical protein
MRIRNPNSYDPANVQKQDYPAFRHSHKMLGARDCMPSACLGQVTWSMETLPFGAERMAGSPSPAGSAWLRGLVTTGHAPPSVP